MKRGIMRTDLGFAGQPGYIVREGQEVWVDPANGAGGDYFVAPADDTDGEDYDGPWILADLGEVSPYVDYADISTGCEPDDCCMGAPWEECDGWEHDVVRADRFDNYGLADVSEMQGYAYFEGERARVVITVTDDTVINGWGHTRPSGCSKQVWREHVARVKRDAIKQLVKWYEEGWTYYTAYAKIEDEELGIDEEDYAEYCGGIDDEDYAEEMARDELVGQLVHNVQKAGYTVINVPAESPDREAAYRQNRLDAKRRQIRYNLTGEYK